MGLPGKVQIPRLERRGEPSKAGKNKHRVSKACLHCRGRKVKCDGGQPTCANCRENKTTCEYSSSRQDKLKTATEQNQDMIRLLKDLRQRIGGADKKKIDDMLAALDYANDASSIPPLPEDERGEANTFAEASSTRDVDVLDEDIHRSEQSRATGFVGKNSEVYWIRQLHYEADHSKDIPEPWATPYELPRTSIRPNAKRVNASPRQGRAPHPLMQTSSCNFYLDEERVEVDYMVDPYELPPFETAERLLKCFMDTVQDSFPILAQITFITQFYNHYNSLRGATPAKLPQRWQAMLNLVFAIGAAYSHLTGVDWRSDERDHLVYHSRAWQLNLKDPWWAAHPDLTQMQLTGLLSFYYLAIGQLNRSWLMIGISLRIAYALGMHFRNEDPSATAVKKELLARVWWGLYSLEQILSAMTGRPSTGYEIVGSVPLPLPLSAEDIVEGTIISWFSTRLPPYTIRDPLSPVIDSMSSSFIGGVFNFAELEVDPANSGTYLKSTIIIGLITQRTLLGLYTPNISNQPWEAVQDVISTLSTDLESWATSLPPGLNFFQSNPTRHHHRERFTLALYYYNTKILIMRPCLPYIDGRIEPQTKGSDDFNRTSAATCVNAAKATSSLLPSRIPLDRAQLYRGSWWSMVHNIMQALTVLLLALSYESIHPAVNVHDMVPSMKKLVRWLRVMKANNGVANRAYFMAMDLLQKLNVHANVDITDLMAEDEATSNAASSIRFDQSSPEALSSEYSYLVDQYLRHFVNNQHTPYNYAVSNPFGVPLQPPPFPEYVSESIYPTDHPFTADFCNGMGSP
ncbi:hypothetical protein K505DRAFT_323615 [Melanomma pulvis-pyrius CBS 109.77]|uniref:Zn(2)-C6 fungal-type domain-containing protein n=1 Tax=Melanomma pulvis-pyrius CBS 109.77 TaxID=1314802 RepID=A0A6A6XI68_9PLEO|nr:hypothetical protein K505DRAFT_323615 [Melanomma pulvis-pyrius CBS 109.77]